MKKIYISFLIVFVVLAALFTISKNMTSGVINTALIAVGEGSNIQVDQSAAAKAEKKKKKKTLTKVIGAGGMAAAAQLRVSKEKTTAPPVVKLVKNAEKQKFKKNMYVLDWAVLGPFELGNTMEEFTPAKAILTECVKNESALTVSAPVPEGVSWQTGTGLVLDGKITVSDLYKKLKGKAAFYALAEVEVDQDYPDAILWIGGRDDVKVWFDGREVFVSGPKTLRSADAAQVKVNLTKGKHTVLVKCAYNSWQCFFYIRFTDSEKVPLIPAQAPGK